jgi:NAD-dependent DNA ligase
LKGVGDTIVSNFLSRFNIDSINKFKQFVSTYDESDITSSFGEVTAENLLFILNGIKNLKPTVYDVLYVASIPRGGDASLGEFAKWVKPSEFLDSIVIKDNIPASWANYCITSPFFDNLFIYKDRIKSVIDFFRGLVYEYQETRMNYTGIKYCITGTCSKPRSKLVDEFTTFGHQFVDANKADVLLAEGDRSSNKYKTAVSRGIPIISELEFRTKYCK